MTDVMPGPDLAGTAGSTRRRFIRDVAAVGASTAAGLYGLDQAGVLDLVAGAEAADELAPISEFTALAASSADALEVPPGFATNIIIGWGDEFANTDGSVYTYGFNNDFLAYFPLKGSEEGIIFVNHEFPDPWYQHGYKPWMNSTTPRPNSRGTKSIADVELEIEATGNSIVHIKRDPDGSWRVVSPSPYNRRVYAGKAQGLEETPLEFTGPLALGASHADPKVHGLDNKANGTLGNCSGGITPWGTALSCEENYDGYGITFKGSTQEFTYGWDQVDPTRPRDEQQDGTYQPTAPAEYFARTGHPAESRKYGWVCEHDPYKPDDVGRKHTALGRFRHENTTFRVAKGKKFTIYMGDDQPNMPIFKFVSSRSYDPKASREEHLKILTEGDLYVAWFAPEGRRRFGSANGGGGVQTAPSGTGKWIKVDVTDLYDTRLRLGGFTTDTSPSRRPRQRTAANNTDPADQATFAGRFNRLVNAAGDVYLGDDPAPAGYYNEYERHVATNRPEDVEVAPDGAIYVALTNNTSASGFTTEPNAFDPFGTVRRIVETGNDPESLTFTWDEFAAGGEKAGAPEGERGFASPDNLVFDSLGGIWVVTDISTGSLNTAPHYLFHKNNAVFYLPEGESGVAYRFANMPVQAEATGPYFTPDESTLFINVQHPGEDTKVLNDAVFGKPETYTSYWPRGNKTTGTNPSTPIPSTVAIYRPREVIDPTPTPTPSPTVTASPAPTPVATIPPPPPPGADLTPPAIKVVRAPSSRRLRTLRTSGLTLTIETDEAATIEVSLIGRVRFTERGRRRTLGSTTLASKRVVATRAGRVTIRLRPNILSRLYLAKKGADVIGERLRIRATDRAGNVRNTSRAINVKR